MKPKTIVLMVVAIVCGLGASYMTSRLLAERDSGPSDDQPKVTVLVAKKTLDMGTGIKNPQELFIEKQIVRDDAPKDAINDFKALKSKYLKRNLRKGDHVTQDDLVDNSGLVWQLEDGMRAVGIRVNPESIAGGFASLPGSKVDVLWAVRSGNNDLDNTFVMTLLEDVMVLAADTNQRRSDDSSAMPANVVTLKLTDDQAKRLTLCKDHGSLSLALRKHGDPGRVGPADRVTLKEVLSKVQGGEKIAKLRSPEDDPDRTPLTTPLDPKIPTVPKTDVTQTPPEKKRFFHVITYRRGDHQWKEVIETDEDGNLITDDVPRSAPENPPAAQPPVNRPQGTPSEQAGPKQG